MLYDVIIIGGGPAGYLAAERASESGLQTLLIEKSRVGGVCLNEGCIPSKTLLHSAKVYDYAKHGEKYGARAENVTYDHSKVVVRKDNVINMLVSGIEFKLKKLKVNIINSTGTIVGRDEEGYKISVDNQIYKGKRLLIATGSSPIVPPIPGLDTGLENGFVVTNKGILELEVVPKHLVVVGGGVIGLEMASYYNSVGSKVTVVEMLDKIAGPTDGDISKILLKNYQKKGVEFQLGAKVTGFSDQEISYEKDGKEVKLACDKVLLSIGRRPNTQGIGLETIGVEMDRGAIIVDRYCKTNVTNVYAAGDVNGKSMLAHTAYREAEVCINNILGKKDQMRYSAIPSVIYTNPEVASVGETEAQADAKGINYKCITIKMNYSGRYVAENEGGDGICKIIVDQTYNKIIGIHMIGNPASEIILSAALMIEKEMRIEDIKELVFPHPTVSEIIREGLFQL